MRRLDVLIALLAGLMAVQTAQAQDAFPSRPIRLIVPYPAGGTTDIMARALQQPMQDILGKPLVVENKPGAAAVIGTREVAMSPPDGYNLAFVNNGVNIAPYLQKDAGFDPLKSFTPISLVSTAPLVLVVHPSVPGNDVKSLIDYAKSKPDGLLYGSAGPGSLGHLSTELFAERAGIKLNHVPYKGQAPSTMGTLAGEVSILLSSASATTYDYAKDGKLKILGVSSAKPSVVVPGARPIGESLPGFEVNIWFGILGPAGIPAPVVEKLQAALAKTLSDPALKERFLAFGVEATSSTSAELGAIMAKEAPEWKKVIEARNIKAE